MDHRKIIGEAWEFTQNNKKMIIWYAFWPSFIGTLYGVFYLIYQFYAFKSSRLLENWPQSFTSVALRAVYQYMKDNISFVWIFIILALLIVIIYFVLPPICEGAMIQIISRKKHGLEINRFDGFKFGLFSFLPLLEYVTLARTFSLTSLAGNASFVARNLGWDALNTLAPVLIIFAIVMIFLGLLFTYTEYFIVIDDRKVIESITKSCVLVIKHLGETLLLIILMAIISIRIIIQLVFVVLIPFTIFGLFYLFALASMETVGIIVGIVMGLVLLYIAAYLGGTIHVFATTVWTYTFLELTSKEEYDARGKLIEEDEDKDD